MSVSSISRQSWPRVLLALLLVAVALTAFAFGRISQSGQSEAASTTGYDIGVAGTPEPNGQVREFQLTAQPATSEIAPGVIVPVISYNSQVPGPTIRVTEGDTVRVTLTNELDQPTSIHWHGLHVPNSMDGVPPFTQEPVQPGQSFIYEFVAPHAGTFMYHSHFEAVDQIAWGLYAPLIIDPVEPTQASFDKEFTMMLSSWNTASMPSAGHIMPDGSAMSGQDMDMASMNMNDNYFTINGKAFPANEPWTVGEGDLVRVRIINISNFVHPMHLHGQDFTVVAKDGEPIRPALQQTMNTISVNAGETYDIVFRADNPGTWVFHCHELHHTENDGVEPGGLIQVIQYEGVAPATDTPAPVQPTPTADDMDDMPGM